MATKTQKEEISIGKYGEEVSKKAEEVYEKRIAAGKPGDELSDWLKAEKEIKKKYSIKK
jgi:hypothetical protein